jgi:alanyl-tRNA synthetase
VERLLAQLKTTLHELESLRGVVLGVEAEKLLAEAERIGEIRLVTALFENRPAGELRALGERLRREPGTVALLAAFDGAKLSLLAACAEGTNIDARKLLDDHLVPFGGRGGGNPNLAQGGGAANRSALEILFKQTKHYLNVPR